jgi:competence protein ComFC
MKAAITWWERLRPWVNRGLSYLYPEVCQLCGAARATPEESYLCSDCRSRARFIGAPFCTRCGFPFEGAITQEFECNNCRQRNWSFRYARAAVVARDPVLEVIHRYKYGRALWFEPFLAGLLITRAKPSLETEAWDAIVPVPLHPAKQREREFNQAERLSRHLSRATGLPLHTRWLRRISPTRTQTQLSREERLNNMRGAFALRRGVRLPGKRLVLVDDVFTTGATTDACARALRAGGAGEICVWTVARGI